MTDIFLFDRHIIHQFSNAMDLLASQQAVWEDFTPAERLYVTTIDTTRDSAELLAGLVRFTSEGG